MTFAKFYKAALLIGVFASSLFADDSDDYKKERLKSHKTYSIGNTLEELSTLNLETAEIAAFMPKKNLLFVVGEDELLEIVDMKNPAFLKKVGEHKLLGNASSVTVFENFVAVSVLDDDEWKNGHVQIFKYGKSLEKLATVKVCSQPDMLTFSPDGLNILVACEGSPNDDTPEDPEGAVAILSVASSKNWKNPQLHIAKFNHLDSTALKEAGVRRMGVDTFYKSLEPEYITVDKDSKVAWVSLQENNAIAKLDIPSKKIVEVFPLGFVDHSVEGFGIDAESNGKIEIKTYPLRGLRQPDGIANFTVNGKQYLLTANEGAPVNDYKFWTDETSPMMLKNKLDTTVFTRDLLEHIKKLTVSNIDTCKDFEKTEKGCPFLYTFGGRSLSLFDGTSGNLLWDSGDALEKSFAEIAPEYFNWNSKKNKLKMDSRSSDKGPEPENVTVGMVGKSRYAFVGLERSSGIAVFDITNPELPFLKDLYFNPRDRGPEGLLFIPSDKSPIAGQALLVVGFEYSKNITVYLVK